MSRFRMVVLMVWVLGCSMTSRGQPFETVYAFGNGPSSPRGNLTLGPDGSFYGTASSGGQYGDGAVFRVATNGNLMTLASFGSSFFTDGTWPYAGLTLGADGNFYGTTIAGGTNQLGGTNSTGAVFRVTTNGTLATVASFNGPNGSYPECKLTIGPNGSFYGTTAYGGVSNAGTVFQVTTNGGLTTLASFSGTNGAMPQAGLTLGLDGNFYGTTTYGGISNFGTIFQVTPGGSLKTLVNFNNTNGAEPYGQLTLGSDGYLYGTTFSGGMSTGPFQVTSNSQVGVFGTIFRVTTNGTLTTLADLTMYDDYGGIYPGLASAIGWKPYGQLIQGADGQFYGTTSGGGTNGTGTIFQVSTNGTLNQLASLPNYQFLQFLTNFLGFVYVDYTTNNGATTALALLLNASIKKLYDFPPLVNSTNSTGAESHSGLTLGPDGNFYAAVYRGGASGYGTIIRVATNGTTTLLASFSGDTGNGIHAGLTLGPDGSLYGATQQGGVNGVGTLFRWSPKGSLSTLHSFDTVPDGANPLSSLTLGPDGNLYGTAINGGTNRVLIGPNSYLYVSEGTVFRVTTNGVFTPVVYFNGTNGANPYGSLTLLGDGNFYGATAYGGISNCGTVFRLTTNGTLTVLGSFTNANGANGTHGKLTVGPNGNLYGMTTYGGVSNVGTVFEVSTQGIINTIFNFTGTNGARPQAGLLWNSDGYFYGTTDGGGGGKFGLGTVFKITPGGALTTLVSFGQTNGDFPDGDLIKGPDGNIYGATSQGGAGFNGTVFRLDAAGAMTTLFSFPTTPLNSSFSSGYHPYGALILFTNGNFIDLYGTAYGGGNNGGGTIFQVNVSTAYAVAENASSLLNPLTNDMVWTIGGTLSLLTAVATNGTAQISGSKIVFTPKTNFTGTATLSYTVTDNSTGTNNSFITILVTNIPPVANPDFYTVAENSSANELNPLANDVVVTSGGVLGLVKVSATNGTAVINGTNVSFTPAANFTGTATIGYTITDHIGGTNTSLITVNVTAVNLSADLSLSVTGPADAVAVGSNAVFTITVSNAGPSTATGVVVSNRIPAGVNFVSATGGATPVNGVLLLNLGTLAGRATDSVQIVVQPTFQFLYQSPVLGQPVALFTNVFQVFANESDPVPANNSASVVNLVIGLPIPGTPIAWTNPGGSVIVTYSVVFGNGPIQVGLAGDPATTGQPGDVVLLASTNGGFNFNRTNWAAVARFYNPADPTGANGLAATYAQAFFPTNVGDVNDFANFQLFTNTAFLYGPPTQFENGITIITTTYDEFGPAGAILSGQLNIDVLTVSSPYSSLNLGAKAAPEPVAAGNNLVYTIIVTNQAGLPATGVVVSNRIPAGVNFVSATSGATPTNGVLLLSLGALGMGASNAVQVVVQPAVPGKLTNVFQVFADQPNPAPSNSIATVVSTVTNAPVASPTVLYNVFDLGSLGSNSVARSVNNPGQIVGYSQLPGGTNTLPVFWSNYLSSAVELSNTGSTRVANSINYSGQIVGGSPNQASFASFWTNSGSPVFFMDSPAAPRSHAGSINNGGQIAGAYSPTNSEQPAFWTNSSSRLWTLNSLGGAGAGGSANCINDSGQIVGATGVNAANRRATFWTNASSPAFDLGTLGGVRSVATSINAAGQIVGGALTPTNSLQAAFWTNNSFPAMGMALLNGATNLANSINNRGQIVGVSGSPAAPFNPLGVVAILWNDHLSPAQDLNSLIPPNSGWVLLEANQLNDWGEIVGFGFITNNGFIPQLHAFALIPVTNADLSLTATAAPEPVGVGNNLVYSLSVSNAGPFPAASVVISNQLPAGVTFVSATGGATPAGGVLQLSVGALAVGTTSLVQVTVQPTMNGKLTNVFTVLASSVDANLPNNIATVVSTVTNAPPVTLADLKLSVKVSPDPSAGQQEFYDFTVTNLGPSAASGIVISNRVPSGVGIVSAPGGAMPTNGVLLVNLGSLAAGGTNSARITVLLPVLDLIVTNLFQVFANEPDPVLTNNFAAVVVVQTNSSTIQTTSAAEYDTNRTTTISLQATNFSTELIARLPNGSVVYDQTFNAPVSGATVQAAIVQAAGLLNGAGAASYTGPTQTSFLKTTNNSSVTIPNSTNFNLIIGTKSWIGPQTLRVGDFGIVSGYTLDPVVTNYAIPTGGHPQTNHLASGALDIDTMVLNIVTINQTTTNLSTILNSSVYVMTGIVAQASADLRLGVKAAPAPVTVGSNLTYTISITNRGPSTATGVTVSNRIPASASFVSATDGAVPAGGILLINLGTLASNAVASAQIVVQPAATGKLTNVFRVFANQADPVLTNNSATVVSTVTNGPPLPVDVALSIVAAPNPVNVGDPLTYSLTVSNAASTTATGVVVSNTLPPGVTLNSVLPSQGTVTTIGRLVKIIVGNLPNGAAATIAIVAIPNAAGQLTNKATAASAQTDSQPANNSVQIVTASVGVPVTNLVVTVLSGITLNLQTGLFEQRVQVFNGGPAPAASVLVLVSGLAANATLYNGAGKTNGVPYVQSVGPLSVGDTIVFTLEYFVPNRVTPSHLTLTALPGPPMTQPNINGTIMSITRMVGLPNGSILVEFDTIVGRIYAVQYSSDMDTWLTAVPAIIAHANRTQWIDAGPPKTDANPAQATARYYRVILLPQ